MFLSFTSFQQPDHGNIKTAHSRLKVLMWQKSVVIIDLANLMRSNSVLSFCI